MTEKTDSRVAKFRRSAKKRGGQEFGRVTSSPLGRGFGMKHKAVAAYWLFAITLVLLSTTLTSEAKAQLPDRSLSFSLIAQQLQTPEQITRYMWRNFLFENDARQFGREDYWQSPEEFLMTRKGDCEDFATFAYEILKLNGYSAYLLNIYGGKYSHTVCVFKENGKYQVIDGTDVKRYNAEALNDLTSEIYSRWETGMIVKPATSEGATVLAEFSKRMQISRAFETYS
jgi:predicted transglutaminase-like cysteine proteinase